jgi:hypothetical protein
VPASTKSRPTPAQRRSGYVGAILVNAVFLYALNRWPGWDAAPFLTPDTERVLGIVTASIVTGIVANGIYLVADPPRLRALGEIVTSAVGLAAVIRIWRVFPFDFSGGFPWDVVVRVLLVLAMAGCGIGILAALVRLVRPARRPAHG